MKGSPTMALNSEPALPTADDHFFGAARSTRSAHAQHNRQPRIATFRFRGDVRLIADQVRRLRRAVGRRLR